MSERPSLRDSAPDPAGELRHAALAIKVRADCGPGSFWSALADWLDDVASELEEVSPGAFAACNPKPALAVARVYLEEHRGSTA